MKFRTSWPQTCKSQVLKETGTDDTRRRRLLTYWVVGTFLPVFYVWARGISWLSSETFHTVLEVSATLLLPGRGLAGEGATPDFSGAAVAKDPLLRDSGQLRGSGPFRSSRQPTGGPPDPFVFTCECDVRPVDYAEEFARSTRRLLVAVPVAESRRTPWLDAAMRCADGARVAEDLAQGLRALAGGHA